LNASTAVSEVDRTHGLLTASVIVLTFLVLVLFGIWLASFSTESMAKRTRLLSPDFGIDQPNPDLTLVSLLDFNEPGLGEFPEAREPAMLKALAAVTETVSEVAGDEASLSGEQAIQGKRGGIAGEQLRIPGPPQEDQSIPVWERWKIELSAESSEDYFQLLENLDVCLGAVYVKENTISFVSDLTAETPTLESGDRESDLAKQVYFRNTRSKLKEWDRSIVLQAGVPAEDETLVVQFYPEPLVDQMLAAEAKVIQAKGKKLIEVKKTTFGLKRTDEGYRVIVTEIRYRPAPG